jgi:hypothetical protein
MHVSIAYTFLGIVQVMVWCVYALLTLILFDLAILDLLRVIGKDPRKKPANAFQRFMQRRGYVLLYGGALLATRYAQNHLANSPERYLRVIGGVAIAVALSSLLFWMKIVAQTLYGVLELGFALGSCGFSLSLMGETFTAAAIIGLLSSIYLMIRAFDNIKKGLDARKKREEAHQNEGNGIVSGTTSPA